MLESTRLQRSLRHSFFDSSPCYRFISLRIYVAMSLSCISLPYVVIGHSRIFFKRPILLARAPGRGYDTQVLARASNDYSSSQFRYNIIIYQNIIINEIVEKETYLNNKPKNIHSKISKLGR